MFLRSILQKVTIPLQMGIVVPLKLHSFCSEHVHAQHIQACFGSWNSFLIPQLCYILRQTIFREEIKNGKQCQSFTIELTQFQNKKNRGFLSRNELRSPWMKIIADFYIQKITTANNFPQRNSLVNELQWSSSVKRIADFCTTSSSVKILAISVQWSSSVKGIMDFLTLEFVSERNWGF